MTRTAASHASSSACSRHARGALLPVMLAFAACGGSQPVLEPGLSQGTPPDLRGSNVMVLPVQEVVGVPGDADAELAFGLRSRTERVDWIFPSRLEEAMKRAPGVNTRMRGLPVGVFTQAEVRRVGDPLYGDLLRLGTLVDAEVVLIPVRVSPFVDEEGLHAVRFLTALVHLRSGRVLWFGVVDGDAHPAGDPRGLASAADEMARTLLWYEPGT